MSILLFVGVVLIVASEKNKNQDISEKIHNDEILVLRYIEFNDSLRQEITNTAGTVLWENFPTQAPQTKNAIETKKPAYLNCEAKICNADDDCLFDKNIQKSVYAEPILVTSSLQKFSPRILKLFCWQK